MTQPLSNTEMRRFQMAEESRLKDEQKQKLAQDNGLVGNPKLDLLYDKAWEIGHANGFSEVEFWFEDLAELIR